MSQGRTSLAVVAAERTGNEKSATSPDYSLRGLVLLAQFHGIAADETQLAHEFGRAGELFDATALLLAAKHLGLKAKVVAQPISRIGMANLPALALVDGGESFIVAKANGDTVLIHDLAEKRPRAISSEEFEARYQGCLLQVASRASVLGELAKFDCSWFISAVVKYRKLLLEVFVVSFFLQMFALVTPLFYQVVMDKVLVHHGLTTLREVGIGVPCTRRLASATLNIDGVDARITPGMALSAEIKTGKRRVIDYLLSPLRQHAGQALRER